MFLKDFSFDLPEELIAPKPAFPRDSSRLLEMKRMEFGFVLLYLEGKLMKVIFLFSETLKEKLSKKIEKIFT